MNSGGGKALTEEYIFKMIRKQKHGGGIMIRDLLYGPWGNGFRAAARFLLDCVYPEGAVCRGCGKISDGTPLCPSCRKRLTEEGAGLAWDFTDLEPGLPAYSLRPHDGLPRQLILNLKHRGEACLAEELARLILPLPAYLTLSPDTVVTW